MSPAFPVRRSRVAWGLCLVAVFLAVDARADGSVPGGQPAQPVPPEPPEVHPQPEAKNLDELLAVVEGEFITRRSISREIGGRTEEESEAEYERRVKQRVLKRTVTGVLVKKAELFGLELKPDHLDQHVARVSKIEVDQAKERAEARKPGSGAGITFEKILAERGQTLTQFRTMLAKEAVISQYWHILTMGVTGKRAQMDPEPSPEDVRSLYAAHARALDEQQGVRVALFMLHPEAIYEEGKFAKYDDAVEECRVRVRMMLGQVLAGQTSEDVARSRGLKRGEFSVTPVGKFMEKPKKELKGDDLWPFDPARRKGDVNVVDGPRGSVLGIIILDVRPYRTLTFDEIKGDLEALIRDVRTERYRLQQTIEAVSVASIQPAVLSEEVQAQLRDTLKSIDEDPIKRDIRLR